jgi:outer membrane protein OmpA-like peptidoglycan-associated protein
MAWPLVAQNIKKEDKALFKAAYNAFTDEEFRKARNRFLILVDKYPNNFEINYYLGACYLNTSYQKTEAIPYLKKAVDEGEESIPPIVHKDLGDLYHESYEFDKALYHYQLYMDAVDSDDEYFAHCYRMKEVCNFAKEIILGPLNLTIKNLKEPVNSINSEFAPYVSTDDSVLFFSRRQFFTEEEMELLDNPDTTSHLLVSYKIDGKWSNPELVYLTGVEDQSNVALAGMSPDGEFIYINALNNGQQDIYMGRYNGDNTLHVELLPEPINSPYWEGKVTISPDGKTLWFSSERPNGIGGKDIYKAERDTEGNWGNVQNVGEPINTVYDENAPFIHPSGKIFYFSSMGHNTMGGYDIFSLLVTEKKNILLPENLGFPINTTGDDTYFILSANGKSGYFSSSYGNKFKNHDLYEVEMNLNIPLTLVKGTILAGTNPKPIQAQIRVYDNVTGKKLKYIYNPNPKTGHYLLIFPPGKNYDMIVEAKNYEPKSINIYIPDQSSFYELFQNIFFDDVVNLGIKVGERIKVENLFYETQTDTTPQKDYEELFELIDALIVGTDSIHGVLSPNSHKAEKHARMETGDDSYGSLFSLIDEAFELGDTSALNAIHNETIIPDRYEKVYFFPADKDGSHLETKIYGNDTILSSPTLAAYGSKPQVQKMHNDLIEKSDAFTSNYNIDSMVVKQVEPEKPIEITPLMIHESKPEQRIIIIRRQIFFDLNKPEPNNVYKEELDETARLLVNNKELGILITGYTDSQGSELANKTLAQKRALTVLELLKNMGVSPNKAILIPMGEKNIKPEKSEEEKAYNRRVEIQVFELKINGRKE